MVKSRIKSRRRGGRQRRHSAKKADVEWNRILREQRFTPLGEL